MYKDSLRDVIERNAYPFLHDSWSSYEIIKETKLFWSKGGPNQPVILHEQDEKDLLENIFVETDCVICMSDTADTLFWPCGHLCQCFECGKRTQQCYMCRETIHRKIGGLKLEPQVEGK